jgi:hypothetical protein
VNAARTFQCLAAGAAEVVVGHFWMPSITSPLGSDDGHSLSLDEIFHANAFVHTVERKATLMQISIGRLEGDLACHGQGFKSMNGFKFET